MSKEIKLIVKANISDSLHCNGYCEWLSAPNRCLLFHKDLAQDCGALARCNECIELEIKHE